MESGNGLHHAVRVHLLPVLGAVNPTGAGIQQVPNQPVQIPYIKDRAVVADFGKTGQTQGKVPELLIISFAALPINHGGPENGHMKCAVSQGKQIFFCLGLAQAIEVLGG